MAMRSSCNRSIDTSNNMRNQTVSKLEQAHRFIFVGKPDRALYIIQEVLHNKEWVLQDNIWLLTILEPTMFHYLELCVDLQMSDAAKKGLIQYKKTFQSVDSSSLERVVMFYLNMGEKRTAAARHQYAKFLDETSTSAENAEDCADKTLTPWVKFLWESYFHILGLFCSNAHLNTLYHKITCMALKFCVKFSKRTEFKKVCHKFAKHLMTTCKLMVQNANKSEAQHLNIETTLFQLDCAIQLRLWQEAYKIVENVHSLMKSSKKTPAAKIKARYYSQLALIFWKTEYYSFHAAALLKFFELSRDMKIMATQEELKKTANRVLAAVLSLPLLNSHPVFGKFVNTNEDPLEKVQRLAVLIDMTQPPTRESLLEDVVRLNVVSVASAQLQQLYSWLEVEFDPLTVCKNVNRVIKSDIEESGYLVQYASLLRDVALVKLMSKMEQYYSCVKFDRLMTMTDSEDMFRLERLLVNCVTYGHMRIAIDHVNKCVKFGTEVNGNAESYSTVNDACKWVDIGCGVLSRAVHTFYSARCQLVRAYFVQHYRNIEHAERQRFLIRHETMNYVQQRRKTVVKAPSFEKEQREKKVYIDRREKENLQHQLCTASPQGAKYQGHSKKRKECTKRFNTIQKKQESQRKRCLKREGVKSSKEPGKCERPYQDHMRQQKEHMNQLFTVLKREKLQRQEDWRRARYLDWKRAEREKKLAAAPDKAVTRVRVRRERIMDRNEIIDDVQEFCNEREIQRRRENESKRRRERKLRRKRAAETARAEQHKECEMESSPEAKEEQRKLDVRLKSQKKKVETFERAKRTVEIPLLQNVMVEKRMLEEVEEASWERQEKDRKDRLMEEWSRDSVTAARLARMHTHRDEFVALFHAERDDAYRDRLRVFETKLCAERERRRSIIRKRLEAILKSKREIEALAVERREREEERLRQREEERLRQREEAERLRQREQSKREKRRQSKEAKRRRQEAERVLIAQQRKNEAIRTRI